MICFLYLFEYPYFSLIAAFACIYIDWGLDSIPKASHMIIHIITFPP